MKTYKLYTYDLWADNISCNDCGYELKEGSDSCPKCQCTELHTSYSVNDYFNQGTVEAENFDEAIKLFKLKEDQIEEDKLFNERIVYFLWRNGPFAGSPACEIREV